MKKPMYPGSLHNHTQYSNVRLRDCVVKEKDLIEYAVELGHEVVAITDHEGVFTAVKVEKIYEKIKKENPDFKVIRGNEIYLCRNGLNNDTFDKNFDKYYHFILLAKDLEGFLQIYELSTRAWIRSYMSRGMRRVPTYYNDLIEIIGKNPGHVIGATACLGGALPTQLMKWRDSNKPEPLMNKINIWVDQMEFIFGKGNFFLEMQPSENKDQIFVNNMLLELSKEKDIPYIITTDTHYLKKEDRAIHKAYLNAQNGDREVDDFYATTYLMGTEELESFMSIPQEAIYEAYENIHKIKEMCEDYSVRKALKIPSLKWKKNEPLMGYKERKYLFEKIPMLQTFQDSEFEADNELVNAVLCGIENHKDLQCKEAYAELNENLKTTWDSSLVNKAQWSAYFLNLQSIIEQCWEAGTLVGPSRGSGGGFLLLYCLDIIQMNKLREDAPMKAWRFLNPERVSVLDIDTDIEGGKREIVLNHLRKYYGENRVSNVATFRTEKSKSAILTAARGLNIDVDIAQYIASLVPADRGQLRSLTQCFYGDEEAGFAPIKQFVFEMTENYPELWEVAQKIEGLVCGSGIHAGGVIFVDEDFTKSTALMRAPDGTICTQFDLHDAEECSLIKMDLLSVEALDKIHNCIDLICDYGYAERKETLKETYESLIGVYNLERESEDMWKMVWNHEISSLFQMEKQSGIQGIAIAKPENIKELAVLNSVIRLMASEKGAEQPLDMWARYRSDINEWIREMRQYGLTEEQIEWLSSSESITDGICESQEGLMSLVQDERVGGNTLTFADKCRKAIAKKQGKLFEECEEFYFKNAEEKGCDMKLAHYIWDVVFRPQRGYSFNLSHTYAYSLIALQEMNLAYKYPIMFWNTACLITDSGGNGGSEDEGGNDGITDIDAAYGESDEYLGGGIEEFTNDDSEDESDADDNEEAGEDVSGEGKTSKKKKTKAVNYGKIAAAIGKIKSTGVEVTSPDINKSTFTFSPDIENNTIRYGLSGITRIGEDLIKTIMENRPYNSFEDFYNRVKVNKLQMISLIKSGAFDSLGDRQDIMEKYVGLVSDTKKRITLQNMKMLIDFGLIPEEYDMEKRVFNFNKYLKKMKMGTCYGLDNVAFAFYEKNFSIDDLIPCEETESGFKILQAFWDKIYKKHMDKVRPYIKENNEYLLKAVNDTLTGEVRDKYCKGSISKWEMDSVSCYMHEHELSNLKGYYYGINDFFDLPNSPEIDRIIPIKGKQVPLFKLRRIAGTVLDRDKSKKTVTLLTTTGVVTVKIYGGVFEQYDKQISVRGADGKKHVVRKSEFSRGNKIVVTGIKQSDSTFLAKKYSKTPYHLVETISSINEDGTIEFDNRNDEVQ